MEKIKILVATQKANPLVEDDIYMPIHVGSALSDNDLNIQRDDEGDNISRKNPYYCELTALYWAWKNIKDCEYLGLAHYRRYLSRHKSSWFSAELIKRKTVKEITKDYLGKKDIMQLLSDHDIILPQRKIFYQSVEDDYCKKHIGKNLAALRGVIKKLYPKYIPSFDYVMKQNNKLACYNMFIARKGLIDDYCEWLFSILRETEREISISKDPYQARVFGFMAERLLNIYCHYHTLRVVYVPIVFITGEKIYPHIIYILKDLIYNMIFHFKHSYL